MIVAAGLSPAWQQILVFDAFAPGAVNRAREVHWCGSGKVLNVGAGLAHLGAESHTIAPLGGPAREVIEREFCAMNVPLRVIACREPTRVCTTVLDRATSTTTELVKDARPLGEDEIASFVDAFARTAATAQVVVFSGSLPSGVPLTFCRDLLARTSAAVILDARGPELLAALDRRPRLVKPNREELGHTLGRDLSGDQELLAAMRELNQRGAEWVVVTGGKKPVWVTSHDATFRIVPPPVERMVNPIGCGDALAAGLAWGIERGLPVIDSVRLGMAAAANRLEQLLPGRLAAARVEQIASRIVAEVAS
ncbi:MAG: bifunctional hydroxymethylpyrimidine kinase/phosphomethylpyrimidine kinase [Planctomycetia bacterium]|nr:bifunctional hydroxymethylpyrimidine kinase/phosphomethylpyrimidine kinase [Planctomycetia bacterium]